MFIEYYFNAPNGQYTHDPHHNLASRALFDRLLVSTVKCGDYPTEDSHNNFIGVRHLEDSEFGDTSYTEFQTGNQAQEGGVNFDQVDFVEYFNLTDDNWQM